jgi:hypothetical protein
MQDLGVDERIILKRILKGQDGRTWDDRSDVGQGYWYAVVNVVMKITVP